MTSVERPQVTTLANGLRVATHTLPAFETATVGVWVDAGARHEIASLNGVSHLLEHMAFKGTKRRSSRDIVEEIESVGGHVNAYTSREHTAYHVKILKDDLPLAVDILSDILQNSVFAAEEMERERAVVIQEIGQSHDTPDDIIFDHFQDGAYPDQPLGRSILGTTDGVSSLSRESVSKYMSHHYTAGRMVLAAAGGVDHESMVKLGEDLFGDLTANGVSSFDRASYTGGERRDERALEQIHLVLGFDAPPYEDDDYFALQVLSTLLGGGMSSRLFQEVRERRGLAYSVFSFGSSYIDGGLFGIYAGTGEENADELCTVLGDELKKICDGIEDSELNRARAQLKSALMMSLESAFARTEQLARQLLIYDKLISSEEILERVTQVDSAQLGRLSARLLSSRPTVAAVGPLQNLPALETIENRLTI